jgi:hypothetical protein
MEIGITLAGEAEDQSSTRELEMRIAAVYPKEALKTPN